MNRRKFIRTLALAATAVATGIKAARAIPAYVSAGFETVYKINPAWLSASYEMHFYCLADAYKPLVPSMLSIGKWIPQDYEPFQSYAPFQDLRTDEEKEYDRIDQFEWEEANA